MQRFNVSEDMLPHVIAVDAYGVQVRMYVALRAGMSALFGESLFLLE